MAIEAIHGYFATGGIIFWILVLAEVGILFRCMYDGYGAASFDSKQTDGSGLVATGAVAFFLLVMFVLGDWQIGATLSWAKANAWHIGWFIGVYAAIGVGWSTFQAWWANRLRGEPYRQARLDWLEAKGERGGRVPDALLAEWVAFVDKNQTLKSLSTTLPWNKQKARILRTLTYWPMSVLWFCLNDVVRQASMLVFNRFRKLYQRVIAAAYDDIADDRRRLTSNK